MPMHIMHDGTSGSFCRSGSEGCGPRDAGGVDDDLRPASGRDSEGGKMKIRGPAGIGGTDPIQSAGPARARAVQGTSAASHVDRVEISEMALFLDRISRLPDIRREKVEAVR